MVSKIQHQSTLYKQLSSESAISERIQEVIPDKGMSSFARAADLSPAAVRKYKKEGAIPRADAAVRIADAAGVSLVWLLTGQGEKQRLHSDVLMQDAAEAAAIALVETDRNSARPLSETSLKTLFEDFYDGFNAIAESD